MHEKFGLQFRANNYKQVLPHEEGSLTKYLSSNKSLELVKRLRLRLLMN